MKEAQPIEKRNVWNKVVRYVLKPLAWIFAILLVLWGVGWIYVINNEDTLKKRVADAIREKTRGDVHIGGLSVSFFRTFPLLSLQLTDVLLKDSVTSFVHKDFFKASDVYLRISIPGLITKRSPIGKILIRNGMINVTSDTSGHTNEYIFKTKPREGRETTMSFPDIEFQNVSASYADPKRKKNYAAIIHQLKGSAKDVNGVLHIKLNVDLLAKNISFNTIRGAYMKEKMLEGKIFALYNREKKDLSVNNVKLFLDNHPFYFTGQFNLDNKKADFRLEINSQNVRFYKASSLLDRPIQKALQPYSVMDPVDVNVKLSGKTTYNYVPLVEVKMNLRNNKVVTPQGMFENCSFDGFFSNQFDKRKERTDGNTYLQFLKFTGRWENIELHSDTIRITNMITPFLECDVSSDVDFKTLEKLVDSKTFDFLSGKTSFDITFKGPVMGNDSSASNINGFINISNATIRYNPRNVLLSNSQGGLRFVNNDLYVDKLNTEIGKTKLLMKGSAVNFLSMLNVSPEKLVLRWNITSPQMHLEDLTPMLSKPTSKKQKQTKVEGTIARTTSKIDKMFTDGDMYFNFQTPAMDYKKFKATGVKAEAVFTPVEIRVDNVSLNHAGGSLFAKAVMRNGSEKNPLTLHVNMKQMDIPQLFTAFENFGQDAVTNKNLKGKLTAQVDYGTSLTNKARIVQDDSHATVNFLLEGGELNNFEPLREISRKAFKKQDFSNIKFADLKNTLELKGSTFIINEMDIRSTALNLKVEGVYDMKKGTDMFIRLPLRNLLKSQAGTDISDEGKSVRGVSLRLRAKTGDDGKLKVSWDPLRLSKRNKKEAAAAADEDN